MKGRRADIHFHLLPGVDDGASTMEESVELARAAEADGTAVIVATPHVRRDFLTASWLLLEAPLDGPGEELHVAADELRDRGFGVVLAHPERSPALMADNAAGLRRELEAGSLLQVNAWSLAGGYGAEAERCALWLVGAGVTTCLASDAHPGWRGPALGVGLEKACWALTSHRARMLTDSAPRALLERGIAGVARAA